MKKEKIPIYKIEVYITDPNYYDYSLEDIKQLIEESQDGISITNFCTFGDCQKKYLEIEEDGWDDSKWNREDTPIEDYRRVFEDKEEV